MAQIIEKELKIVLIRTFDFNKVFKRNNNFNKILCLKTSVDIKKVYKINFA
jgi:hypothetical protein